MPAQVPTTEPEFGPYAKAILEQRKAQVRRLQGFAAGLQAMENMAFMFEVLDEMVFGSSLVKLAYVVSFSSLVSNERGLWAKKSKRYFENEEAATEFAYLRLIDFIEGRSMRGFQLKIEFDGRALFWCSQAAEAGLKVINNELELQLPLLNG